VSDDELYAALDALRAADDRYAASADVHWRVIDVWLRTRFGGRGADADDARQETMISIARHVREMEADQPAAAAKWVATIHRRKRVDAFRSRKKDAIARGLERTRGDEEGEGAIELVEGGIERGVDPRTIERVVADVEDRVAVHLEETCDDPIARHARRTWARAALRRLVFEEGFEELEAALGDGKPLPRDRVYKWVERGRPIVLAALEGWESEVAIAIREIVAPRRIDAGRPRPERRKG
jgi:DNA-directed RNA polymerase specialized sigma24 family protein